MRHSRGRVSAIQQNQEPISPSTASRAGKGPTIMFIITKDIISSDEGSPGVGTMGPRQITDDQEKILTAIAAGKTPKDVEAVHFKMYDDDDNHYYSGYWVDTDTGDGELEPLDCYGMPNAGCTYIKVRGQDGKYTCV